MKQAKADAAKKLAERVVDGSSDPYAAVDELLTTLDMS